MGIKYNLKYFNKAHFEKAEDLIFKNGDLTFFSMKSNTHEFSEDSFGYLEIDGDLRFIFVADGMGGHQGGAKASEIICKCLEEELKDIKKYDARDFRNTIIDVIEKSNEQINALKIGAGSTFSGIQITETGARFFNSGDSMGLLLGSRGKLKHKVIEHSPLGFAIEAGVTTREQDKIEDHIISNALGFSPMWLELSEVIPFSEGDILSVFSDGILTTHKIDQISDKLTADLFPARLQNLYKEMSEDTKKYLTDDTTIMLFKINSHTKSEIQENQDSKDSKSSP